MLKLTTIREFTSRLYKFQKFSINNNPWWKITITNEYGKLRIKVIRFSEMSRPEHIAPPEIVFNLFLKIQTQVN